MRKHKNIRRAPGRTGHETGQHVIAGKRLNGFATAIAWPETHCKQPGSWFSCEPAGDNFRVRRFSPKGYLECENIFMVANKGSFDIEKPYSFEHISHCRKVHIYQDER